MKFESIWTGEYPCLCFGRWEFYVDGRLLNIPEGEDMERKIENHMGTKGTYCRWYFDDDYLEDFEDYEDGLDFGDWYIENQKWINEIFNYNNIPTTVENCINFYKSIQKNDFRLGSCGGCI